MYKIYFCFSFFFFSFATTFFVRRVRRAIIKNDCTLENKGESVIIVSIYHDRGGSRKVAKFVYRRAF